MQFASVLLLAGVASAAVLDQRNDYPSCNADNCARQVRITRFGEATQTARAADCTEYLRVTVTSNYGKPAETKYPYKVPFYASSCDNDFKRYSSACVSCIGAPVQTTTVYGGYQPPNYNCNHDNCLRGLFGDSLDRKDYKVHTDDCSSYLATTVEKKWGYDATVTPYNVPYYASAKCTPMGDKDTGYRFSSACRCAGVSPTTYYKGY